MIDGIDQSGGISPLGSRRIEQTPADPSKQPEKVSPDTSRRGDSATISENAAEVARYQEIARLHREAFGPEDRSAKLDEVRQRIQDGYYNTPEFDEELTGRLVEGSMADQARASDVDIARRRTEEGFYDRPEVVDKTAENVVRSILGRSDDEQ